MTSNDFKKTVLLIILILLLAVLAVMFGLWAGEKFVQVFYFNS